MGWAGERGYSVRAMDGIHDLGGVEGFGRVATEAAEPVFHSAWERRALGLTMASFTSGVSNGGQFRHSIERMDPAHYLSSRYYEHWATGVATRFVEEGLVPLDELEQAAGGIFPMSRPVASHAGEGLPAQSSAFEVGDRVRVRRVSPRGHTRCPRYVRGCLGTVVRVDPPASLPDLEAHSAERRSEPVYCVRFSSSELWGENSADSDRADVHVDLWASYLEAM